MVPPPPRGGLSTTGGPSTVLPEAPASPTPFISPPAPAARPGHISSFPRCFSLRFRAPMGHLALPQWSPDATVNGRGQGPARAGRAQVPVPGWPPGCEDGDVEARVDEEHGRLDGHGRTGPARVALCAVVAMAGLLAGCSGSPASTSARAAAKPFFTGRFTTEVNHFTFGQDPSWTADGRVLSNEDDPSGVSQIY